MTTYKLGISTCPNDTFMFHAILERAIDLRGVSFEVELLDVQQLNQQLAQRRFDISKVSTVAAFVHSDEYELLHAGSAVGFGVGPLLLARQDAPPLESGKARVALPGDLTTAALLYRRFFPHKAQIQHLVFSEIMPALQEGHVDYGVVIHEGRFTYQEHGLTLVRDLGTLWEETFDAPLPLGCLVARCSMLPERVQVVTELVRESIQYAYAHRSEALVTMRRYAQELSDEVIWAHVDLYVNEWSLDLGVTGRRAMESFRALVSEQLPKSHTGVA